MLIDFTINGTPVEMDIPPHHYCIEILRDEFQYQSMSRRCNNHGCGTCLILLDDKPALACLLAVFELRSRNIWTIEGLAAQKSFQDILTGFSEANAHPCAHCAPARAIAAEALLRSAIHPSVKQIEEAVRSVRCPCTSSSRIIQAMRLAAKAREWRLN